MIRIIRLSIALIFLNFQTPLRSDFTKTSSLINSLASIEESSAFQTGIEINTGLTLTTPGRILYTRTSCFQS